MVTPEGVPICSCVLTFPFKQRRTIGRVQIVQEAFDRVILRAAPVDGDATAQFEAELAEAHAGLQQILGEGVTIRKRVDSRRRNARARANFGSSSRICRARSDAMTGAGTRETAIRVASCDRSVVGSLVMRR